MREITSHKLNELNEKLKITAMDEPGSGGANHKYQISLDAGPGDNKITDISFQNGPIKEAGFNGITNESLLAICIDRMKGFQSGQFANRENALALTHMEDAMHWLQHRTRERLSRGVEGTLQK
jgi:hypothetical protein